VILDDKGQPMMPPAGLDPHFFVSEGLKDKEIMNELRLSAKTGEAAALAYLGKQLLHFYQWNAWDARRVGGSFDPKFVDYATVIIGLYAAALGLSRAEILHIEDLVARGSDYKDNPKKDSTYRHLPERNVHNTDRGYLLYQSGRVAPSSKP
jgi:hypothetical protein